jgi:beta-glucosidase/6-phospho-beta-glucosidase/beta-galactosidase
VGGIVTESKPFSDGRFRLGVGIEDTFVVEEGEGRRALDEYELTQHYERWEDDLALAAQSGATTIRYGLPWYRLNPGPGQFDWSWADRVVDRLMELGLEVIFDLVHYGTPHWLEQSFLNRDYPEAVADYARALAERYGDRIAAWTPLNEPQWTARRSGEMGIWPPALTGHDGYVRLVLQICRGICLSQRAIQKASRRPPAFVHVEATFRYAAAPGVASDEMALMAERRFLALDLVTGRVGADHPLHAYLSKNGAQPADLAWFEANAIEPDIIGLNYYPMWSTFEYADRGAGIEPRERDDGVEGLLDVVREYGARYGKPVMVTETSFEGTVDQQVAWLRDSVAALLAIRAEQPVAGYVWWPFFDQFMWQYREGTAPLETYLHKIGMVRLAIDGSGAMHRRPTAVFDVFRSLARAQRDKEGCA